MYNVWKSLHSLIQVSTCLDIQQQLAMLSVLSQTGNNTNSQEQQNFQMNCSKLRQWNRKQQEYRGLSCVQDCQNPHMSEKIHKTNETHAV